MTRDEAGDEANECLANLEAIVETLHLVTAGRETVPGCVVRWLADQVAGERHALADVLRAMQAEMPA